MNNQIYKLCQHFIILSAISCLAYFQVLDSDSIKFFLGIIIGNMYGSKTDIANSLINKKQEIK